ncbi:hypothetical protein [Pseudomonas marginalis]|uniref:hypothetical protein n=1 Tax=Pseudomonas marginalis TaxID=298 RepID=UPI0011B75086|nr:hypothetical protein [Pseudomonas marginalis]KAA8555164.1 hypothetical protein FX984_01782 [Pseudomonas marginalis]TWR71914.1 hypothetical protein FIV40_09430 [Pseudomonas marginalis]
MISILQNEVERLRGASNELAMQREAFLNSGGTIQVLEGVTFRPPPVRHEPPPRLKGEPVKNHKSRSSFYYDKFNERMKFVSMVREMAKTMTIDQAMEATGRSESTMCRAAFEGDFSFQRRRIDCEKDRKLIERLSALRDVGLSRRMACIQVEISANLLRRLEKDYGFSYPKRWTKPKVSEGL